MLSRIVKTLEDGYETAEDKAPAKLSLVSTPVIPQSKVSDFIQNPNSPVENNISKATIRNILIANYRANHVDIDLVFTLAKLIGCRSGDDSLNLDRLQQLKIMDLGCGGQHNKWGSEYGYLPWLCRQLHACDVDITGVDLIYPKYSDYDITRKNGIAEDWNLVIADLSQGNALANIRPNEFDVVNARYIMNHGNADHYNFTSPTMSFRIKQNELTYDDFERQLFLHALRILKSGGVFVVNEKYVYKKTGGRVVFHFEEVHGESLPQVSGYKHIDDSFM